MSCRVNTFSRYLQKHLIVDDLEYTFPRYLNIILESSYLDKRISTCLNYVFTKMASIKLLQDGYMTDS